LEDIFCNVLFFHQKHLHHRHCGLCHYCYRCCLHLYLRVLYHHYWNLLRRYCHHSSIRGLHQVFEGGDNYWYKYRPMLQPFPPPKRFHVLLCIKKYMLQFHSYEDVEHVSKRIHFAMMGKALLPILCHHWYSNRLPSQIFGASKGP
jgi:hypothetical protein